MGWQPAALHAGQTPGRKFAVTFDDGYRDNLIHAAPVLSELSVPATFFLTTGFLESERLFPWLPSDLGEDDEVLPLRRDEARELVHRGFKLGSHTATHPHLTQLPDEQIQAELRESREAIAELSGQPCRFLVYPFGTVDERVALAASQAGYDDAYVTPPGPHVPNRRFTRHRVGVYRHDSLATFALKTSFAYRCGLRQLLWRLRSGGAETGS